LPIALENLSSPQSRKIGCKRGVFASVVDLQEAINRFVVEHNSEPNPSQGPPIPTKLSGPSDAGTKC
jgi:hypothetical protein